MYLFRLLILDHLHLLVYYEVHKGKREQVKQRSNTRNNPILQRN